MALCVWIFHPVYMMLRLIRQGCLELWLVSLRTPDTKEPAETRESLDFCYLTQILDQNLTSSDI